MRRAQIQWCISQPIHVTGTSRPRVGAVGPLICRPFSREARTRHFRFGQSVRVSAVVDLRGAAFSHRDGDQYTGGYSAVSAVDIPLPSGVAGWLVCLTTHSRGICRLSKVPDSGVVPKCGKPFLCAGWFLGTLVGGLLLLMQLSHVLLGPDHAGSSAINDCAWFHWLGSGSSICWPLVATAAKLIFGALRVSSLKSAALVPGAAHAQLHNMQVSFAWAFLGAEG